MISLLLQVRYGNGVNIRPVYNFSPLVTIDEIYMIAALETDLDVDLSQFSQYLHQLGLPHRITEEGANQVVWVPSEDFVAQVHKLFEAYKSGTLSPLPRVVRTSTFNPLSLILRFPLTVALIMINAIIFPLTQHIGDDGGLFQMLMFTDFRFDGDRVYFGDLAYTIDTGQYWRLLTPMFIHFGWLHVVFNLLWVWEIGRRIEVVNNASVLLLVTLVSSLMANLLQYYMSGPSFFGGMSGVVFGYLGYSLVWSRLVPSRPTGLAPGLYIFMFVYLAIGFTGAIDILGLGVLANGAHLGGLIGGLLVGGVAGFLFRSEGKGPA